jgi:hypothetical protein
MPEKRSCLYLWLIGAVLLSCTWFAGSLFAGSVSLPVVNPGFEQGMSPWQESHRCSGVDCYISGGIIQYGYQDHVFDLARTHGCGPECFSNYYIDTIFQTGIVMPSNNDVRWNFWIEPFASWTDPYSMSTPFVVEIGLETLFDRSGNCSSGCLTFQVVGTEQGFVPTFGPTTWGSFSFIQGGYYVKSDNLSGYFAPGDILEVSFGVTGNWGTDGDHEYYQWMSGYVNDRPPIPEPSSILLFGTGILGLAALLRRKLF